MLHNLRRPGDRERGSRERPEDLLLACHERLRTFSSLALELVDAVAPSPREISDAASAVHRYFSIALPLHVADEERTIRRALLEAAPNGPVADALDVMAREHSEHELILADLIPCWSALAQDPRLLGELAPGLGEARRLQALLEPHLALEEARIFPALASLPEPTTQAVLGEMRARRTTPASAGVSAVSPRPRTGIDNGPPSPPS